MSSDWNWPGSRWWRFDLHTHSPASHDYSGSRDEQQSWSEWVDSAVSSGLDAVAITDHNDPGGFEQIRTAAKGRLVVFPGVEVTVGGVHLLLVFDPKTNRDSVVGTLAKLGIPAAAFGKPETVASKSVQETIALARSEGALVIAAHVNGPKGIFKVLKGQERASVRNATGLFAAEVTPSRGGDDSVLPDDSDELSRWLEGHDNSPQRLPRLSCSDAHAPAELGRGFTWIKMSKLDSSGLALALLDGDDSLRTATRQSPGNPNAHAQALIESIAIRQAKYIGRANGDAECTPFELAFNPWLNVVIGGRGTGKSTIVDLLRLALRREGDLPSPDDSEVARSFHNRMRIFNERTDPGLLTALTRIEVIYRKDGARYRLTWEGAGRGPAIELLSAPPTEEHGDIRTRFPVRIYSQKQLFELASRPTALLAVIDDSPEVDAHTELQRIAEASSEYLARCSQARSLRTRASQLPARLSELNDVRRKLEVLQAGDHAGVFETFATTRRHDRTWSAAAAAAAGALDMVQSTAMERLNVADIDFPHSDSESSTPRRALLDVHAQLRATLDRLRETITTAIQHARDEMVTNEKSNSAACWRDWVTRTEHEYERVTEQFAAAGIHNPDDYPALLQRAAKVEQEIADLRRAEREAHAVEADGVRALERYRKLHSKLTEKRKHFAQERSAETVRVEIIANGGRSEDGSIDTKLRELLNTTRFEDDRRALRDRLDPSPTSTWSFAGLDEVVAEIRSLQRDPTQQWVAKDGRFQRLLRELPPDRVDQLALLIPEDAVAVSFKPYKNASWKSIEQGSPGQRTATLLAFVLGHGDEPIILDQPEDDLDNAMIYDILVQRLRAIKSKRQVIVVTHNPNIVVHGDAELVISLDVVKDRTVLRKYGGMQDSEVREEICRVMEGGRKAFAERHRRLMLREGDPHGPA